MNKEQIQKLGEYQENIAQLNYLKRHLNSLQGVESLGFRFEIKWSGNMRSELIENPLTSDREDSKTINAEDFGAIISTIDNRIAFWEREIERL